jgi:hypothetical protein
MGVIPGGSVMLVVFWSWNQGNVSRGMCLVSTGNGSVDRFLRICLVDRKDFWVSERWSRAYVMFRWLTLGTLVSSGAVRGSWLST